MYDIYASRFRGIPQIQMLAPGRTASGSAAEGGEWVPWFIDVYVRDGAAVRAKLMQFLQGHEVQTRAMFPVVPTTPAYARQAGAEGGSSGGEGGEEEAGGYAGAQWGSASGLFLPSSVAYTDEEVALVADLIRLFFCGRGGCS